MTLRLLLLAVLSVTVGLGTWGWVAGVAYGIALCGLLGVGLQRAGMTRLGWANSVTFGRAILTGGVTAMVLTPDSPVALLVTVAAVALAMDGVDGQVARRTGTTTSLGARFDMEIDAFLILMLSIYVGAESGRLSLLTYNVAGLPQLVSHSDPEVNVALISPLLNHYDVVLVDDPDGLVHWSR